MAGIFISYRRGDSSGHTGRLCDRLTTRFGDDGVFMDIQDIQPGQNFVRSIEGTIGGCDVVVAVIGPRWLEMLGERTADAQDFVRHEIAAALARNVPLIPVLVGGARMPRQDQLPTELAALSTRQAVEVRDDRFDDDVARLIAALDDTPALAGATAGARRRSWSAVWKWAVPVVVLLAMAGGFILTRQPDPPAPTVDGAWLAEMQDSQQRGYKIRLQFVQAGGEIGGVVDYPTGTGAIHDAALVGRNLTFSTTHTPQFASEPATIRFRGTLGDDELKLTATSESGIATGVARRIAPRSSTQPPG